MQYGKFFIYIYKTKTTALTLKSSPDWHSYPKDSEGIQGWKQVLRSDRRTLSWEDYQQKKCFPHTKNINIGCLSQTLKCMQSHIAASVWEVRTRLGKHASACVCECGTGGLGGRLKPDQSCRVVVCSIRSFEIPTDLASNKTRSTTLNVPIGPLYCWMQ